MTKKKQQQKRPAAAAAAAASSATSTAAASNKASDAPSQAVGAGAKGSKKQPPYLALLETGEGGLESGPAAVEKALEALEALTEKPEAFVAPPPELAQVSFRCGCEVEGGQGRTAPQLASNRARLMYGLTDALSSFHL